MRVAAKRTAVHDVLVTIAAAGILVGGGLWWLLWRAGELPAGRLAALVGGAVVVGGGIVAVAAVRAFRRLEQEVLEHRHAALHDPLTKLANRTLFEDRVAQRARERSRSGHESAVMLVALDGFKELSNTMGRRSGDRVLTEIGRRLTTRLRRSDTVARLGGDQFGVLLPMVDGRSGAETVMHNVVAALKTPIVIGGVSVVVDPRIGVALMDAHSDDGTLVFTHADQALYEAARNGTGLAIYDAEVTPGVHEEIALISDLRQGILRGELRLFYQPKAQIASRRIRSMEALVRWQHPKRGLLTPNVFVPLAERNGLMRQLTYWVLDEAMRQAREWADQGPHFQIAVNLSQQSLLDESMPDEIARVLERHRVPASALEIEITESALVSDLQAARVALERLHAMGIALSIDDYGTGHSSLAHVRALPVGCIKIDRSFVSGMLANRADAAIVRSTVELARDLEIGVVAEGVETMEEWDALNAIGCRVAQGFLISKPKPGDELIRWLEATGFRFRMDASHEADTPLPDFATFAG